MKLYLLGIILFLTTFNFSFAQILTFEFSALGGAEPTANSNTNDANIFVSTISRGAGLAASANGGRFNATNWATGSIANAVSGNNYMEFTITPNPGCNFTISSIQIQLQRSGTGPSAIALRSSLDGFTANLDAQYPIVDNTTTQSFTFTFAQTAITTATTYRIYMYAEATGGSGGPGDGAGNDIIVNGSTNCVVITNTITIDAVSSLTFGVDCTTGANGAVDITTTDVFTAGNIYTVELSDASGSFASPINIGSLASTNNSATINFTIPSGTATGSGYRIRVVSSAPSVTSADNGSNITITLTGAPCVLEPPHMTSVIINSCDPTCDEGYNEIVFGTSGDYSFNVTTTNFSFEYGSNASPAANTNYTDVLVNNSTQITELETAAGCPGLFIDAFGTTIPPNASWMLAYTGICEEALDWTGLCGSGPIYVIFQNDPSWNTGGNFVNSNGGMRYLNTTITTTSLDVFDIDYNFNSATSSSSDDGSFVQYSSSGGSPILYGDDDCLLTPIVLPIELYSFTGELIDRESYLYWTTLSEYNFSHFEIFHATDVTSFYKIGTVNAAGNTDIKQDYRFIHPNPVPGINYYRLAAIDNDGTARSHGIIALNLELHFAYFNGNAIVLESPYAVEIYNLQGQLIVESSDEVTIPFNHKGVFFIRELNSGTTQKIVIQ